jgi:hypothetical protein
VQKSPKGAAGLAQQTQKRQRRTVRTKTDYNHIMYNAFADINERRHTTISYKPYTHTSEGNTLYIGSTLGIIPISL